VVYIHFWNLTESCGTKPVGRYPGEKWLWMTKAQLGRSLRRGGMLWKSRSCPPLTPRFAPHRCHTRLILLLDFLPCFPSFPLVTCHRYSPYFVPCATSTRYRAISHRHDSLSATLSSALYIQPMYLLYLVRFELVGLYTACTSHIPSSLRAIPHYCASVPWCCDISLNLLSTSLSSSILTPCSPLDTSSAEHRHPHHVYLWIHISGRQQATP